MAIMTDTRWDRAISNISAYIAEKENDGDGEARVLHLLYEARELLEEGVGQDARDARNEEGSTRSTEVILQSIEDRLTKIEKQKQNPPQANTRREARPLNGSYAAAVKRNAVDDGTHGSPRSTVTHRPAQTSNAPRKGEKEITIRIANKTERRKVREGEAKELVEKIKKAAPGLIRVNRMGSGDIKVTASTKEAKAALLKNTEWIKVIETSAAL